MNPSHHLEGDLQHLLAEHQDITEQGLTIQREDDAVVLRGEVLSAERRETILHAIAASYPEVDLRCEVTVIPAQRPDGSEVVS